jgi:diguanylate cyclase (GGDEF)-like protein
MLLLLLAAVAFALPATITLDLKRSGEEGIEVQNHLQSFITELRIEDGLEWRLVAGGMTWQDVKKELTEARERADRQLDLAKELGLSSSAADQIVRVTNDYSKKVDEEVRLLSVGEKEEAAEFDEAQVDPAFDQAATLLQRQADESAEQAEAAQRYGNFGVLLTVLLSLMAVSSVQSLRKRAEVRNEAQRQGEARYRTLIDQSSDLVAVVDRAGRADFISPSVERLLAPQNREPVMATRSPSHGPAHSGPVDFITSVDPLDRARFATALQTAVPGRVSGGEFRLNGRHGTSTCEVTVQDLTADPSVSGLLLTGHDVTERIALQQEMEHRALHDTLTGLPNRALLADRFDRALIGADRAGGGVGLLLLDLDRFKEINDTFGHHYGDELLRQIGPRLLGVLRGVDTVARLGGDEFAVLLPDVHGVEDATNVANALLVALEAPFKIEGVDLDVEASIGVVISGMHGNDPVILMQRADIAMYVAKTQHLGVFVYNPGVDGHSATKLAMVGDLRRALDRHELVLYYQPKVNISTREVVGAEALVRWQHPEHGLVFPDDFIPLAERTGLINPLTRHVLNMALKQATVWLDSGRPLPIAVNLSARNLHDERFADMVAELLATHDVPAHLLELEVTESAIMIDPERARAMLEKLSSLGIYLSLDDFGAGYTSLSQLTSMPISEIKIDRSFVMTMAADPSNALIVSSVVDLGHNLGMKLVAEGVETETALTALSGFGCDIAQGYHLSRPIPVGAFDTWCANRPIAPAHWKHDSPEQGTRQSGETRYGAA